MVHDNLFSNTITKRFTPKPVEKNLTLSEAFALEENAVLTFTINVLPGAPWPNAGERVGLKTEEDPYKEILCEILNIEAVKKDDKRTFLRVTLRKTA